MKIKCKHCSQEYEIDETMFNHKVECSVCHKKFLISEDEAFSEKSVVENINVNETESNVTIDSDDDDYIDFEEEHRTHHKAIIIIILLLAIVLLAGYSLVNFVFVKDKVVEKKMAVKGAAEVICNKFTLNNVMSGDQVKVFLQTDLPDNARVGLMVYRSCDGNDNKVYSIPYFRKTIEAATLKDGVNVNLAKIIWDRQYQNTLRRLKNGNRNFKVKKFSNDITVYCYLGASQKNSSFGSRNVNLKGRAVHKGRFNSVSAKKTFSYPLTLTPNENEVVDKKEPENNSNDSIEIEKLKVGIGYIISRKVPLYPALVNKNTAIIPENVKSIPSNGIFIVKDVKTNDRNIVWYKVEAYNAEDKKIGDGWINSMALVRQELAIIK